MLTPTSVSSRRHFNRQQHAVALVIRAIRRSAKRGGLGAYGRIHEVAEWVRDRRSGYLVVTKNGGCSHHCKIDEALGEVESWGGLGAILIDLGGIDDRVARVIRQDV